MEENTESSEFLVKLALIASAVQESTKGRATVIYEVGLQEFQDVIYSVNGEFSLGDERFKVEISGTDFIFILYK